MNKNGWLMLFALAAASSVSAQTVTPPAPQPPADYAARFKAADRDNDGTLDKAEAAAMPGLARKFDAVDADHDGTVDMKEIEAYHAQMTKTRTDRIERRFKAADTDHDGTIDQAEAAAWPGLAKRFAAVDTDHDGTVDLNEVKAAMGKPQGPMMGTPPPQPAPATKP
jgi:Ca2+-binding EF-hand superfamily protein